MSIKPKNSKSKGFLLIEFVIALAVMTLFIGATGRMMSLIGKTYATALSRLRLLSVARGQKTQAGNVLLKDSIDLPVELRDSAGGSCQRTTIGLIFVRHSNEIAGLLGERD